MYGRLRFDTDVRRLLDEAARRARATWDPGAACGALLDLLREIREKRTNNLSFTNYTQMPIAQAFLLAQCGHLTAANSELASYITDVLGMDLMNDEAALALKRVMDVSYCR
jgi:hypothetical protein